MTLLIPKPHTGLQNHVGAMWYQHILRHHTFIFVNYLYPGPGLPEVSVTLRSGDRFPLQWLLPRDQLETLLSHWDSELNETQLQSVGTPSLINQ